MSCKRVSEEILRLLVTVYLHLQSLVPLYSNGNWLALQQFWIFFFYMNCNFFSFYRWTPRNVWAWTPFSIPRRHREICMKKSIWYWGFHQTQHSEDFIKTPTRAIPDKLTFRNTAAAQHRQQSEVENDLFRLGINAVKLSELSIKTNKSEHQSKMTQLSFLPSIIHLSNRSSKLYLSSMSLPPPPVNYSVLNSSHCIYGDMPIKSLPNRVCIPLNFSTRSCIWYVNYCEEVIFTSKPVLVTTC